MLLPSTPRLGTTRSWATMVTVSSMPAPCVPSAKVRSLSFFPAELARHFRGHGDAGGASVGGGVGDLVFSGSAGGPLERHAVYGRAVTVVTLPTASLEVLHHERAQFADTHRGAVLLARGIGPTVGHGDRGTLGWRVFHRCRFGTGGRRFCFLDGCCLRLDGRRFGCCTWWELPLPNSPIAS